MGYLMLPSFSLFTRFFSVFFFERANVEEENSLIHPPTVWPSLVF